MRKTLREREQVLDIVRAEFSEALAPHIVSAGCEAETLTLGAHSSAWASRLRYAALAIRGQLAERLRRPITKIRIRVVASAR